MKSIKYILVLLIFSSSIYANCFVCGVVPQEWNLNLHMASNEYADEIKKKKTQYHSEQCLVSNFHQNT